MWYNIGMSKEKKDKASVRKRGIIEFIGGAVVAAIGGIASFASYQAADYGESYTVYTGIIALGVIYALKGIYDVVFPSGFGKKEIADEPVESKEVEEVKEED